MSALDVLKDIATGNFSDAEKRLEDWWDRIQQVRMADREGEISPPCDRRDL